MLFRSALPLSEPSSFGIAVKHPALGANGLDARLRSAEPPLVSRIEDGRVVADVRTLGEDELPLAARAFVPPTVAP